MKRLLCMITAIVFMLISLPITSITALADTPQIIKLNTLEDWNKLAENCRLDSYSKGIVVELEQDIDLSDNGKSIPYFCGKFNGNGHKISAVSDKGFQSLFRIIDADGVISDLNADITLTSADTECSGIICSINNGKIENCKVYGSLSADQCAGGHCRTRQ